MYQLPDRLISLEEHAARRQKLLEMLGAGNMAIVFGASVKSRNRDSEFAFRQNSDFFYLTGLNEPDAVLLIAPGSVHGDVVLFVQDKDPTAEVWTGVRTGQEGAKSIYGADNAYPLSKLSDMMPTLLDGCDTLFVEYGMDKHHDQKVIGWCQVLEARARRGAQPPNALRRFAPVLHEQRLIKSPAEINAMRRAGEISAEAHKRAMRFARPGVYEYAVEAEIVHDFSRHGCGCAYSSIVAGGGNACILHYVENNQPLNDGDLLLIDAGAELDCYAADITRTFPVNGKYSGEQKAVYDIVLDAQLNAIAQVMAGNAYDKPHQASLSTITRGLVDLGLLVGDVDALIEDGAYKQFFMHNTGHWLGMDVHDVGAYKLDSVWRSLQDGMVVTIEPGIYIADSNVDIDAKWHNIGIRIEDDVVVSGSSPDILTKDVPKTVADIEAVMREA